MTALCFISGTPAVADPVEVPEAKCNGAGLPVGNYYDCTATYQKCVREDWEAYVYHDGLDDLLYFADGEVSNCEPGDPAF